MNTTQALEAMQEMLAQGAGGEHVRYLAEFVAESERGSDQVGGERRVGRDLGAAWG